MARSTFSQLGLPIGEGSTNMTYLYGVSDFFAVMFEDPEKVNLLLEAGATVCSETYSRFLQLTSSLSLEDIQETIGHTIKLVTIKSSDSVEGEINTYKIADQIVESRYIANRPLLPTTLFEGNIDFRLEPQKDGSVNVRFARDISDAGFPTRLMSDGVTREYAMWFVDCEIDEQLISKYFGGLVDLQPQASTEVFKNFVYGLFYIYANGPVIDLIRKGMNLALGIPLCRGVETVLEIRKYLDTDQYIVITDANQYVIPYGLPPVVEEGQVLNTSDEIARWVEVQDYTSNGDWWINLQIPATVIPNIPAGQKDRYATEGSYFDELMRTYLKKHTFLVKVKVTSFKEDEIFQELGKIIRRAKPSYTAPIYIWAVEHEDVATVTDEGFIRRIDQFRCENLNLPIDKFYRNNTTTPLYRGCPTFNRFNAPMGISNLVGENPYLNGDPNSFMDGVATGFINNIRQIRENTVEETAWLRTILSRGNEQGVGSRGKVGFMRNVHKLEDSDNSYKGFPVQTTAKMVGAASSMRIIPLYVTTQNDIKIKCSVMGIRIPDITEWSFDLLNNLKTSNEINTLGINEAMVDIDSLKLKDQYSLLFFRGAGVNYLSNIMPEESYETWAPGVNDLRDGDYVLGIRIYDKVIGMYWVTSNFDITVSHCNQAKETDCLKLDITSRPTRGLAPTGSSFYQIRGRGSLGYNNTGLVINEKAINEAGEPANEMVDSNFTDQLNTTITSFTRAGDKTLKHRMELN